ncbi:MAG: hypothetical protein JO091_09790, partial [Acidobacteriaceae bacterium]|nr:hypothetical protein [Acidobacteriaceae bacterium]
QIGGWAIDDTAPISGVSISVDGVPVGGAPYGNSRPDVCGAFPGRPGCPNVGWTYSLDTTALADGMHTLDVIATSITGQHTTATTTFQVANLAANPLRITIDVPGSQSAPFSGLATFGGWSLEEHAAVTNVMVSIDGVAAGSATYGVRRDDVCAAGTGVACPAVGWTYVLDTTAYANGGHTLEVTATAADGHRGTASTAFTVGN